MSAQLIRKLVVVCVFVLFQCLCQINGQQYVGDQCTVARTGAIGTCKLIDECPAVITEIIQNHLYPTSCGFVGRKQIVCCPRPATKPPITTKPPHIVNRISAKKCIEYQDVLYERTYISVGFGQPPMERKVFRCPIATVPLIVGGQNALAKEFPHMALIGYQSGNEIQWSCGGTLISEQYVLTAAHCVYGGRSLGYAKYVRLGDLVINSETDDASPIEIEIVEHIKHPEFKLPSKYNDIALLKLMHPVKFSQYIRPACLPETFYPQTQRAIATGWGLTEFRGKSSDSLMKVVLDLYGNQECNATYINHINRALEKGIVEKTQLCAGSRLEQKDTCQGDSGGPIQTYHSLPCMYSIDGVTSFGKGCGDINSPGVYTRVFSYLDWIESIVWRSQ